ncbi:MAG TPA: 2-hydroxyacid dehydrogenase [Edaphobacter sp.]
MIRIGVDEKVAPELLSDFPPGTEIVRIPRGPGPVIDVDFWIIPFARKDAKEAFQRLRGVKAVQSLMAGVDWILPWLPRDITLCDGRGIHDISTSEWVLAAVLSSVKRIPLYARLQEHGDWRGQASVKDGYVNEQGANAGFYRVLGDDLAGKTVLIVGYGSIGAAIEARMTPFGVDFLRVARTPKQSPPVLPVDQLNDLLPQADVVVLIVPLTENTQGMIGEKELALMKPGALLVNAARGPVVKTDALLAALQAGHIYAALDVTDPEPLPQGHPLWTAPNCLITPHVAGSTPQFIYRGFRFAAAQVRRMIDGEPLENTVSEHGY